MPIKNLDKCLDPPDEPEGVICESCGKPMEILFIGNKPNSTLCQNALCPDKYTGNAKALAEHIVDLEDTIERQNSTIKRLKWQVAELTKAFEENK